MPQNKLTPEYKAELEATTNKVLKGCIFVGVCLPFILILGAMTKVFLSGDLKLPEAVGVVTACIVMLFSACACMKMLKL